MSNEEQVIDAFVAAIGEIKEKLDVLNKYVDDHMGISPEVVTWGDVGSANRISENLEEIILFCNLRKGKNDN